MILSMDHCVFHGTVNKVVDQILAMHEETGDFGELVYAGMDWVDPALAKRSMQLMAEQVMPRVNAAIGKAAKNKPALPPPRGKSRAHRAPTRTPRQAPDDAGQSSDQKRAAGEGLHRETSVALVRGRLRRSRGCRRCGRRARPAPAARRPSR